MDVMTSIALLGSNLDNISNELASDSVILDLFPRLTLLHDVFFVTGFVVVVYAVLHFILESIRAAHGKDFTVQDVFTWVGQFVYFPFQAREAPHLAGTPSRVGKQCKDSTCILRMDDYIRLWK